MAKKSRVRARLSAVPSAPSVISIPSPFRGGREEGARLQPRRTRVVKRNPEPLQGRQRGRGTASAAPKPGCQQKSRAPSGAAERKGRGSSRAGAQALNTIRGGTKPMTMRAGHTCRQSPQALSPHRGQGWTTDSVQLTDTLHFIHSSRTSRSRKSSPHDLLSTRASTKKTAEAAPEV